MAFLFFNGNKTQLFSSFETFVWNGWPYLSVGMTNVTQLLNSKVVLLLASAISSVGNTVLKLSHLC